MLENLRTADEAAAVAKKIFAALAKPVIIHDDAHQISTSIGIALVTGDGQDAARLLSVADDALYEAKRKGRGCYAFADLP